MIVWKQQFKVLRMNDQIILSVPAKLQYLKTVENFVDVILQHFQLQEDSEKISYMLRSTVNEAFVNVIKHPPTANHGMVSIYFNLAPPQLTIRFPDKGKGLKLSGHFPPYPKHLIGSQHILSETIDGKLMVKVEAADKVRLFFKEEMNPLTRKELLKKLKSGGMGLSIIVKFMDEVRFIYNKKQGHYLEVKKTFN